MAPDIATGYFTAQKSNRLQQNYTKVQMREIGPGVSLLQMRDSNSDSGPKLGLRGTRLRAICVSCGLSCNFVVVYFTCMQFILQLKLCLYTIVNPC